MTKLRATAIAQVLAHHTAIAGSLTIVGQEANVFTVEDIAGQQYLVTVEAMFSDTDGPTATEVWQKCPDRDVYSSAREHARKCGAHFDSEVKSTTPESAPSFALPQLQEALPEFDDDGDDDEVSPDPENFDGGFGNGSWFRESMSKDD